MAKKEIMKWKSENDYWFTLKMEANIQFREFMDDILNRNDNYGKVQIQIRGKGSEDFLTLTYDRGLITWISDEKINRMGDCIVESGRAHGFPTQIDYYIWVKGS